MTANVCQYKRAYTYAPCPTPAVEGYFFCHKHLKQKCWCGSQAVKECCVASSFVCGAPTCEEHECHYVAGGFTGSPGFHHSKKGQEQFKKWKEEQKNASNREVEETENDEEHDGDD